MLQRVQHKISLKSRNTNRQNKESKFGEKIARILNDITEKT